MENIKETSLDRVLKEVHLAELPKQMRKGDGGVFWRKAIALVRKRDMTTSYAIAARDDSGMVHYVADYGTASPITSLLAVHPFLCLTEQDVRRATEERRIVLVAEYLGGNTVALVTDKERMDILVKITRTQRLSMPKVTLWTAPDSEGEEEDTESPVQRKDAEEKALREACEGAGKEAARKAENAAGLARASLRRSARASASKGSASNENSKKKNQ